MAASAKIGAELDLKPRQSSSFDFGGGGGGGGGDEEAVPFLRSASRRRGDTWIVSLFVLLHVFAFVATMAVNNCGENSHGECALGALGRFSFQPLPENPLLGPSASTLDEVGALRRTLLTEHQTWRLFTAPWLHAGIFHLLINLVSVVYLGIHLEQEFGPLRSGMIYTLSALVGSLVSATFVQDSPQVGSSAALFGLLGAMLAVLIRYWRHFNDKCAALLFIFSIFTINFALGLLPYIDNFSSIGGFTSGFLLGFVSLYKPHCRDLPTNKVGLFDYGVQSSIKLKQKLDKPVLRIVALLLFGLVFSGCLVTALWRINLNQYCSWCHFLNCIPSKRWSCNDMTSSCEILQSVEHNAELTLTCMANGKFMVFPFTNISPARVGDLCTLICS
ncbi:RHOMBOID-like protein 8 [Eucalyptus grandis]|uniref:RHOMBOID-like protein 8 n=1 Tax=Eucalyptus grandis TaxID=71139 RepID=UPI00192EEC1F|nr:RHOMBOID-like protein 8 [Eucalyptus grandis]